MKSKVGKVAFCIWNLLQQLPFLFILPRIFGPHLNRLSRDGFATPSSGMDCAKCAQSEAIGGASDGVVLELSLLPNGCCLLSVFYMYSFKKIW